MFQAVYPPIIRSSKTVHRSSGGEPAWNMYSTDSNKEYCITLHLVGYKKIKKLKIKKTAIGCPAQCLVTIPTALFRLRAVHVKNIQLHMQQCTVNQHSITRESHRPTKNKVIMWVQQNKAASTSFPLSVTSGGKASLFVFWRMFPFSSS